jgi:hypothetical protein
MLVTRGREEEYEPQINADKAKAEGRALGELKGIVLSAFICVYLRLIMSY